MDGIEAAIEAPAVNADTQPESVEDISPVSEEVQANQDQREEKLPFGKHPRWIKMNEENRTYKTKLSELEQQLNSYNDPSRVEQMIRSRLQELAQNDPNFLRSYLQQMESRQSPQEDPLSKYSEYAPEIQELAKELHGLREWKQQLEQKQQLEAQQSIEQSRAALDEEFDSMLLQDNFLNEQGEPVDKVLVDKIGKLTLATLLENNPERPTSKDLQKAYKDVKEFLGVVEKRALAKTAKPASVPASGSRSGVPAQAVRPKTEQDRIDAILGAL